ncbi:MAG: RNA pyrophosphohydrolase [Chlamydiia bacterium]|nr:RNA pyrophosphohydrolase [Chlamydiia bacterium]
MLFPLGKFGSYMDRSQESVSVVIFKDDYKKILLIKREDVPVWALPGGGIEENETTETTAVREVEEETGLKVKIKRKVGEFHPKNRLTKLTHLYECTVESGSLSLSDETIDIKYFDVSSLPNLMPPPYQEWIYDAAKNLDHCLVKKTESVTYLVLVKKFLEHPILVSMHYIKKFIRTLKR